MTSATQKQCLLESSVWHLTHAKKVQCKRQACSSQVITSTQHFQIVTCRVTGIFIRVFPKIDHSVRMCQNCICSIYHWISCWIFVKGLVKIWQDFTRIWWNNIEHIYQIFGKILFKHKILWHYKWSLAGYTRQWARSWSWKHGQHLLVLPSVQGAWHYLFWTPICQCKKSWYLSFRNFFLKLVSQLKIFKDMAKVW